MTRGWKERCSFNLVLVWIRRAMAIDEREKIRPPETAALLNGERPFLYLCPFTSYAYAKYKYRDTGVICKYDAVDVILQSRGRGLF